MTLTNINIATTFSIALFLLIGCKKDIKTQNSKEQSNIQETIIPKEIIDNKEDSISVFSVSFMPNETKSITERISEITKGLQPKFVEYPFTNDVNELKDTKQSYKSKRFLKILARDFNNTNFLDVGSIHYAYILPNHKKKLNYISIEEWSFNDVHKANSCFNSLKNYRETEIYFKTINWIWVYQNHKIFLIFSTDFMVTDPEMQDVKQELIKSVSKSGEFETIQFYE